MIEVRQAERGDIDTIAEFQMDMARETEDLELDDSVLKRGIQALFDDDKKGRYFVALVNGKPVGSLMITYEWSDWRNGNVWWIQSVFIAREYRRQGLFRAMYESIKQKVQQIPEVCGLRLYVFRENHHAKSVYKKLGMAGDHYEIFEWMK